MEKDFNVASFFSGAGGLDRGFVKKGFKIAIANDVWHDASKTFKINHPEAIVFEKSIGELSPREIEQAMDEKGVSGIDVVIGGPPCQCFTRLNNEYLIKNKADSRRELFKEYIKKIEILKPKLIFMENVRDLIVRKDEHGTPYPEVIVRGFKKAGYFCTYFVLNAVNFNVPQERQRIIFVATNDRKIEEKIGKNPDFFRKISKSPKPVKSFLKKLLNKKNLMNHEITINEPLTLEKIKHVPQGGYYEHLPDRLKTKKIRNGKEVIVKRYSSYYRRLHNEKPANTITNNYIIHPTNDRYLTNREKAILHTFPTGYFFCGGMESVSQQIANSVPPNFASAIADYALFLIN